VTAKRNVLGSEAVGRLLLRFAVPAIVATTASSFYHVIDRMIIGNGVGPLAISGLALTFPIWILAVALGTLVGAGAGAVVSIRLGEQRLDDAVRTLGNALVLNLLVGTSFAVLALSFLDPLLLLFGASEQTLPYARDFMQVILSATTVTHVFFGLNNIMRSSGHPMKAMGSVLLTVAVNLVLALLFVLVLGWGIRGAAWATVLSQGVGMLWVLAHFLGVGRRDGPLPEVRFRRGCFRLSWRTVGQIVAIGASPFLIHTCGSLVAILTNLQLGRHGGDLAIGAYGVIQSVLMFVVMVIFGLTQGMQPIVGFNYGARQLDRVQRALALTMLFATAVSILGVLVCQLFPWTLAQAFSSDEAFVQVVVRGMRIQSALFFAVGFQIVVSNFFQSIGKAKVSIVLSLTRQILFLLPLLLLFPALWGLDGVWAATPAADLLSALVTGLMLWLHVRRGLFRTRPLGTLATAGL
jgi:putative MATE family efflux protein